VRKLLLLLTFLCFLPVATPTAAQFIQQRFLPANGVRGVVGEPQVFPMVKIGSRTLRLSPGARIYDRSNRTIVHAQLPPGAEVLYSTDQAGDIQRMYILSDDELVRLRQAGRR
jgi:hypothetical protein